MERKELHWPNSVPRKLRFYYETNIDKYYKYLCREENTLHVLARSLTLQLVEIYIKLEIFLENAI